MNRLSRAKEGVYVKKYELREAHDAKCICRVLKRRHVWQRIDKSSEIYCLGKGPMPIT